MQCYNGELPTSHLKVEETLANPRLSRSLFLYLDWLRTRWIGLRQNQKLAVLLFLAFIALTSYKVTHGPALTLSVEYSCESSNSFQVFYDTGDGYVLKDSYLTFANATPKGAFKTIRIPLPHKPILNLRMDPGDSEGIFRFRRVVILRGDSPRLTFTPADLVPRNHIANKSVEGRVSTFTTVGRAYDPEISLHLDRPFSTARIKGKEVIPFVLVGELICWALLTLAFRQQEFLLRQITQTRHIARTVHRRAEDLAQALSVPGFLSFDVPSIWFYSGCLLCFLFATIAGFNSSAVSLYGSLFHYAPPEHQLIGEAHPIRSDEWSFETPIILNEALKANPFQIDNSYPGNHDVSLIANAPVWHFTTIFRPQLWAFFLLRLEYAYAYYWQFKALFVLTGVFTFLLLVTQNSRWSCVGALWYFFSPCTQWTYSWPSALPEMAGLMCLTTVLGCYLTIGQRPRSLVLAAVVFTSCAVNLAMCAYLPHLIPYAWLSIFTILAWFAFAYRHIFQKASAVWRAATLGVAILIVGAVGLDLFYELQFAIVSIGKTAYPGVRRFAGGSLGLEAFTSHFLAWTESEVHFPKNLANVCESAGFLWLAPVTLFAMKGLQLSRKQRIFLVALWLHFLLLFGWLVFPFPTSAGHLFGLDLAGGTRLLPALGLSNIAIVCVCMSAQNAPGLRQGAQIFRRALPAVSVLGVVFLVFVVLHLTNQILLLPFSSYEIGLGTLATTILVMLVVKVKRKWLAAALLIPQALLFGFVNPIQRGLASITESPFFTYVQAHPELKRATWLVYSQSFFLSGFVAAAGCDVYSGIKYLPDVDHFPLFESSGLPITALNRDAAVVALAVPPQTKPSIEVPMPFTMVWHISPIDPLLRKMGIKYFAFDHKPDGDVLPKLTPLTEWPEAGIWLYKAK